MAAFDAIVETYSARIHTLLLRLLRDREEAEDLAQEAFVRAYRGLASYDRTRSLRNWLYAIATNVGLNGLRTRYRRLPSMSTLELDPDLPRTDMVDPRQDVRRDAMNAELRERLAAVLDRLPPRSAALVHLHYREGLSIAEAADMLGMTEGAAKVALHRARKNLREWLIEDDADGL
jgi:RNA polymerase sigma-70 factor (ECF subfamily)